MASAKAVSQSESWGAHREAEMFELRREGSLIITQVNTARGQHVQWPGDRVCPRVCQWSRMVPNLFSTRDRFHRRQISKDWGAGGDFRMILVHYIYCALYFHYYCISSI